MNPIASKRLQLTLQSRAADAAPVETTLTQGVIAGWTSRDSAAMEQHIAELEEMGVARPPRTPIFYRVSVSRFTTDPVIEVPGEDSSGEAEFVLLRLNGQTCVGLGSDHTDRKAEAYNVTVSKQMCDKPLAPVVWPLSEVTDHWDQLVLRSFVEIDGRRTLYQEGPVSGMLPPEDLLQRFEAEGGQFSDGTAMLCGTLPAIGGLRIADAFSMELEDPVLGRRIEHRYSIVPLANEG